MSDQLPWSDTHPDRRAFVVFRDYPGSWSDSNEQPDFKESGSSPTSPPRRTYSSLASVSAETTFYWACHFRFSLARKFPFLEIEKPIAETQEAEDEMLPSPFGGIPAAGRRVALPGARLEGIKLRINRPSRWVNRWQVRGFGVAAPIRWADHTGARSPSRAADAHRLRL